MSMHTPVHGPGMSATSKQRLIKNEHKAGGKRIGLSVAILVMTMLTIWTGLGSVALFILSTLVQNALPGTLPISGAEASVVATLVASGMVLLAGILGGLTAFMKTRFIVGAQSPSPS